MWVGIVVVRPDTAISFKSDLIYLITVRDIFATNEVDCREKGRKQCDFYRSDWEDEQD